jgi:hypothetical protein
VASAVPGGDEELDGAQEVTARSKRWSTALRVSCNDGDERLELGVAAVLF